MLIGQPLRTFFPYEQPELAKSIKQAKNDQPGNKGLLNMNNFIAVWKGKENKYMQVHINY